MNAGRVLNYEPTPQQIAAECAVIRATWTPQEALSRLRADMRPTYRTALGHRSEMTADAYEGHHDSRLQESER